MPAVVVRGDFAPGRAAGRRWLRRGFADFVVVAMGRLFISIGRILRAFPASERFFRSLRPEFAAGRAHSAA
jgi:hypothetical protein